MALKSNKKSQIHITILAVSERTQGVISDAFSEVDLVDLCWLKPDQANLEDKKTADIIILDDSVRIPCSEFIDKTKSWAHIPSIIALGEVPVQNLKALIRHPKADAIADDISSEDLRHLVLELKANDISGVETGKSGECWVITGAVGGAGASLLAIETAYQLLQKYKDKKVCLVDLNFEDGSLATFLDTSPGLDASFLSGNPDRLDASLMSAFTSEHKSGLTLMATPRGANHGQNIRPESVLKLLEIACDCYDYVVVDFPRWRQSWTGPLTQGADQLIIVSELTVPALHAARHLSEDFESLSNGVAEPDIILNRMSNRMFGHSVTVTQAETALKRKTLSSIPSDWDAAAAAVNMGMPVSMAKPGAKFSKGIGLMIAKLLAKSSRQQNVRAA